VKEIRLMTPGPTQVPPAVLGALAQPVMHHRTPQYARMLATVRKRLGEVFQTSGEVLVLSGTGTAAMEAAVTNLHRRGDTAIVIQGGKFGERWAELTRAFGLEAVVLDVPWGESVEPAAVAAALERHPRARTVLATLVETSTATAHDLQGIGRAMRDSGALLVVDAVSGAGAQECRTDAWGVDVLVSASQKGLMLPPGLAFVTLSERARKAVEGEALPRYYLDLRKYLKAHAKDQDPWTGSVALLAGLQVAADRLLAEGMEGVWRRHRKLAAACRAAVEALGLRVYSKRPSDVVTAALVPEEIDGAALVKTIRDELGVGLAGGQDALKGRIVRIGHLGYVDEADLILAIGALERGLHAVHEGTPLGAGLTAAQRVLASKAAD
jgi:aspartate aminotransferase-like enzyme